jgi:hypothetical protein
MLLILLAASLLPALEASMHCVDAGTRIAATQTQPLRGPDLVVAVLKVSSSDDRNKNSHLCNAEYRLLMMRVPAGAPVVVDLLTTDADWDRVLSLSLYGFSHDGKRVFGVLTERGKFPTTTLFDYDTADGKVQLTNLTKQFAHIVAARCSATFDVIGTTETGAIVLELSSEKRCAPTGPWLLNTSRGSVQFLPPRASYVSLYEFKVNAP